ncbi:hypothetical protein OE88DRAFT_1661503 [Heliocybe sulcata]|uniref:Uncharacterized protein n=1 Tax=Heliocybe sulcata TaxID=5364 RepID=A0A5C3MYR6_9AGAM|nr:hypothetical protein OE88DRAFT_1661503 [Heliocybe sulcata]
MPTPIGNFISREVYDNRLRSVHDIQARTSCRFVDVSGGKEMANGKSWRVGVQLTCLRRRELTSSIERIGSATSHPYRPCLS